MLLQKKKFQRFGPIYKDPIPRFHVGARQRSKLTDGDLNLADINTDFVFPEGDNYVFGSLDTQIVLYLKTQAGAKVQITVVGDTGAEQIQLVGDTPDFTAPFPIPNTGFNFEFSADNYLRFFNVDFSRWNYISAELPEIFAIESPRVVANPGSSSDADTYNVRIKLVGGVVSLYFRYIPTGALYKPWVIDNGGGVYTLELTAQ